MLPWERTFGVRLATQEAFQRFVSVDLAIKAALLPLFSVQRITGVSRVSRISILFNISVLKGLLALKKASIRVNEGSRGSPAFRAFPGFRFRLACAFPYPFS